MPHATPLPVSELKSDENPKVSSDMDLSRICDTKRCVSG